MYLNLLFANNPKPNSDIPSPLYSPLRSVRFIPPNYQVPRLHPHNCMALVNRINYIYSVVVVTRTFRVYRDSYPSNETEHPTGEIFFVCMVEYMQANIRMNV